MKLIKGGYVHATRASLISFMVFAILVFAIPGVGPSEEVQIILTISTFLFAILAGFFISRLSSRYNDVRGLVGEEDAKFISLYKTSLIYSKAFADRIADLIDRYYIKAYDKLLYSNVLNSVYFDKMWAEVRKMKKHKSDSVYEKLLDDLTDLEKVRNTAGALEEEKLGVGKWTVLVFLSGIILFSIFYLKTAELYSQVITIMLSTVLALVLFIIRDLQNFMFGGKILMEESGEKVMETIGRPRYYNKSLMDAGVSRVPDHVREYRLGLHDATSHDFKIKLVKNDNYRERDFSDWRKT